jgi:hypothetical protein
MGKIIDELMALETAPWVSALKWVVDLLEKVHADSLDRLKIEADCFRSTEKSAFEAGGHNRRDIHSDRLSSAQLQPPLPTSVGGRRFERLPFVILKKGNLQCRSEAS